VTEGRPEVGPSAALRLIGHRNFGPYFVGNASSATGTWFQNLAASLFTHRQTHSPFLLGVLQFATPVPILLRALGRSAADRFDRRNSCSCRSSHHAQRGAGGCMGGLRPSGS
jgi:hypothetical protein